MPERPIRLRVLLFVDLLLITLIFGLGFALVMELCVLRPALGHAVCAAQTGATISSVSSGASGAGSLSARRPGLADDVASGGATTRAVQGTGRLASRASRLAEANTRNGPATSSNGTS